MINSAYIGRGINALWRRMNGGLAALGYGAAESTNRRKTPSATLASEDEQLKGKKRNRLISSGRELVRNQSIAGWAIRKHLDFVASFNFQSRTGDDAIDNAIEDYITVRSRRDNADVRGIHPLRRMVRMGEARATLDGDVGFLKLRSGHLQAIESDRWADPPASLRSKGERWFQGVLTDRVGRPRAAGLHDRVGKRLKYARRVRWSSLLWHAAHDTHHRFDVTRGVGPVVAAINDLTDIYAVKELAIAKAKVANMFGLIIYSDSQDGAGSHMTTGDGTDTDGDGDLDQERYTVDFGKGPIKLELDEGDRAEFLEAKQAAQENVAFLNFCIAVALKSLDLPFSLWDESFTNFFGSKAALTLYLLSAGRKRDNVRDLLNDWAAWQLNYGVATGQLRLPRSADLAMITAPGRGFEWIATGLPWFDRVREVGPTLKAIGGGLTTHSREVRELYGVRFEDILAEAQRDQRKARAAGAILTEFKDWFGEPPAVEATAA